MVTDLHAALFAELGIAADYGTQPLMQRYREATELEDIGPNILGRPVELAPP